MLEESIKNVRKLTQEHTVDSLKQRLINSGRSLFIAWDAVTSSPTFNALVPKEDLEHHETMKIGTKTFFNNTLQHVPEIMTGKKKKKRFSKTLKKLIKSLTSYINELSSMQYTSKERSLFMFEQVKDMLEALIAIKYISKPQKYGKLQKRKTVYKDDDNATMRDVVLYHDSNAKIQKDMSPLHEFSRSNSPFSSRQPPYSSVYTGDKLTPMQKYRQRLKETSDSGDIDMKYLYKPDYYEKRMSKITNKMIGLSITEDEQNRLNELVEFYYGDENRRFAQDTNIEEANRLMRTELPAIYSNEPGLNLDTMKIPYFTESGASRTSLKIITSGTFREMLHGYYHNRKTKPGKLVIIDCRHPYEYQGGHFNGAINIASPSDLNEYFKHDKYYDGIGDDDNTIFVFHCEFSSSRGPGCARAWHNADTWMMSKEQDENKSKRAIVDIRTRQVASSEIGLREDIYPVSLNLGTQADLDRIFKEENEKYDDTDDYDTGKKYQKDTLRYPNTFLLHEGYSGFWKTVEDEGVKKSLLSTRCTQVARGVEDPLAIVGGDYCTPKNYRREKASVLVDEETEGAKFDESKGGWIIKTGDLSMLATDIRNRYKNQYIKTDVPGIDEFSDLKRVKADSLPYNIHYGGRSERIFSDKFFQMTKKKVQRNIQRKTQEEWKKGGLKGVGGEPAQVLKLKKAATFGSSFDESSPTAYGGKRRITEKDYSMLPYRSGIKRKKANNGPESERSPKRQHSKRSLFSFDETFEEGESQSEEKKFPMLKPSNLNKQFGNVGPESIDVEEDEEDEDMNQGYGGRGFLEFSREDGLFDTTSGVNDSDNPYYDPLFDVNEDELQFDDLYDEWSQNENEKSLLDKTLLLDQDDFDEGVQNYLNNPSNFGITFQSTPSSSSSKGGRIYGGFSTPSFPSSYSSSSSETSFKSYEKPDEKRNKPSRSLAVSKEEEEETLKWMKETSSQKKQASSKPVFQDTKYLEKLSDKYSLIPDERRAFLEKMKSASELEKREADPKIDTPNPMPMPMSKRTNVRKNLNFL